MAIFSAQVSPIAIDFGSSSVKLLQIGSDHELIAAAALDVPEEIRHDQDRLMQFYATEIPKTIRRERFKGRKVVTAVPSGQTFVQHMQVPMADGIPLDDLIKTQLQVEMGCSPQGIVVRSVEVAEVHRDGQARREIICFAASRDTVMRYVDLLKRCRLEPVGMHTETMAMVRAFDHINRRVEDTAITTLFVDFGHSGTRVAVCHGRFIKFARYIPIGGRSFDQVIASTLNCDIPSARAHRLAVNSVYEPLKAPKADKDLPEGMAILKSAMARANADPQESKAAVAERRVGAVPCELRYHVPNDGSIAQVGVDVSELLETVTDELSMCLRYHRALFPDRRLDRMIFLGGESRQMWLCQHVVRELRAPAQLGDPLARLMQQKRIKIPGVSIDEPQPGWAVTCGLCKAPTDF